MQWRGRRYGLLPILVLCGILPVLLAFSQTVNCPSPYTVGLLPVVLDCWPSPYTVGFLPILLTFYLHVYCRPYPYIVGLLPILLVFSLYGLPYPYTVGHLPILLALSLCCWFSPYTVGFLPILLTFYLHVYCWPSPYTIPVYSWPSPYTISYIQLAFSLYCWLSLYMNHWALSICVASLSLCLPCVADLWDTHTTPSAWTLPASHARSVYSVDTQCSSSTGGDAHIHKCLHHVHTTHADVELCSVCFKHEHTHQWCPHMYLYIVVLTSTYIRYK